ncbi:MAG: hypothetical protein ACRC8A_16975 [Microcoleaceae cyanobacterium]
MSFAILAKNLPSRKVRAAITGSPGGVRIFAKSDELAAAASGIGGFIRSAFRRLVGFISQALNLAFQAIRFSFTKLWQWTVNTVQYLWTFNWDVSDTSIDAELQRMWNSTGGLLGGFAGQLVGWTACGFAPGAVIAVFNEPLGRYLMAEVGQEAVEELAGSLASIIQISAQNLAKATFLWTFKSIRSLIKRGLKPQGIDLTGWGNDEEKDWSFARQLQKKVGSIQNEWWQEFVEEFFEEAFDSCQEAGYALAGAADSWYAQQEELKRSGLLGQSRTIEFYPNKEVKSERLILTGPEQLVKAGVISALNTRELLDNRQAEMVSSQVDLDVITPLESVGLELKLEFYNFPETPYFTKDRRKDVVRSQLVVPNANRAKLGWNEFKGLFSGQVFSKGIYSGLAVLDNGKRLKLYASSEQEVEQMLVKMAQLTTAEIIYPLHITKRTKFEDTAKKPDIKPQYLGYVHIVNWPKITNYQKKKGIRPTGKYGKVRLPMQAKEKPSWWDEDLRKALSTGLA